MRQRTLSASWQELDHALSVYRRSRPELDKTRDVSTGNFAGSTTLRGKGLLRKSERLFSVDVPPWRRALLRKL
jgi:hypothetical protein